MAEYSFPFENIDTTEEQFSQWASNFQETGVQGSPLETQLEVSAEGSTLEVEVAAGQAFIRGHYYINNEPLTIAVPSAGVNTRIDIVVLELNPEENTIVAKLIQGTAVVSSPVAPTLTQTSTGVYQLPLAQITIPNSTLAITSGMLTDLRRFMGQRFGLWTTATRPTNPTTNTTIGYNTTIGKHEYWDGVSWTEFGGGSGGGLNYLETTPGTSAITLESGWYTLHSNTPGYVLVNGVAANETPKIVKYTTSLTSLEFLPSGGVLESAISAPDSGTTTNPLVLTFGNGLYVSGTGTNIARSSDARTWTRSITNFGATIFGIAYGAGVYVAAGASGTLRSSTDAITWTTRTSGFGTTNIDALTFGTIYVAGGVSGIMTTSTDGITWTTRTSGFGTNAITALYYGNNLYLAGGAAGTLTTSTDAITWTTRSSGTTRQINGFTYGGGLYVLVGRNGAINTSTDAITWTSRSAGTTNDLQAVAYGNNSYLLVGNSGVYRNSSDAITWLTGSTATNVNFTSVIHQNNLFVAGNGGSSAQYRLSVTYPEYFLTLKANTPIVSL